MENTSILPCATNEIYKVLYYPHALLKKKSTPVLKFTDELRKFIKNLIATAYQFHGGGIAAPQVGVCKRIFIGDYTTAFAQNSGFDKNDDDFLVFNAAGEKISYHFPMIFINPEIIKQEDPIYTNWEGCLSFPNIDSAKISRFRTITIKAQNEFGEVFSVQTSQLYATVNFQHEIDHLNGILMIDHWDKKDYIQKQIIENIKRHESSAEERKKIKKLKLVDASKIKFDFL